MKLELQKQAYKHDPKNGTWGDCHRTAVAMVLGLNRDQVPHFYDKGISAEAGQDAESEWLAKRGMAKINVPLEVADLDRVLDQWDTLAKGLPYVLGGFSRNGTNHSVAVWQRKIFDPSIDESGIVGPMDDGYFWATFIVKNPSPTLSHSEGRG